MSVRCEMRRTTQLTHIEASSRRTQTCSTETHSVPHIHRALHALHAPHADHYGSSARRSEHRTARRFVHTLQQQPTRRDVSITGSLCLQHPLLCAGSIKQCKICAARWQPRAHISMYVPLRLCRNRLQPDEIAEWQRQKKIGSEESLGHRTKPSTLLIRSCDTTYLPLS